MRVAIIGLDGSGKTTLINNLLSFLEQNNICSRSTKVDFECKSVLKKTMSEEDKDYPLFVRLGMAFDFLNHYLDLNDDNEIVFCDRYDICYKVLNRVDILNKRIISKIDSIYDLIPRADLYLYLEIDSKIAFDRLNHRGNRAKNESLSILRKIKKEYNKMTKLYRNVFVLNACEDEKTVFKNAVEVLKREGVISS